MLCYIFLIFAIVGCDGRDVPTTVEVFDIDELESFNVTAVPIPPTTPQTVTRIIGGTQTTIENYPYAVQILYYNQPMCGGSLLTRLHVLSAAHCFVSENGVLESARFFRVRVGTTYLNSGGSVYSVSSIINHERYNHTTHDNDISVLLLSSRVTLGSSVKTALIPQQGDTLADNSTVVVIGWGSTHAIITTMSSVLNEVSVRTVNRGICTDRYNYLSSILRQPHPITDTMMCAGLLDIGGADACQGDSGGPLIYDGLVVGITSWGYGCARPRYPGVYAQVSVFTSWINQTVIRSQRNSSPNSHAGIVALLIPIIFIMLSM